MDPDALEALARQRLEPTAYDYFAGGADDELTVAANAAAWTDVLLRPRVLRDVADVDPSTTVLGTALPFPVLVAPMAYQRLAHDEGEAATARGAAATGTPMVVSTLATVSLEDVAAAAPDAARWFQLYVYKDRGFSAELVARAVAAGYRALVVTVDLPVLGNRRRDDRNRFTLPPGMLMANAGHGVPEAEGSGLDALASIVLDASLTPADVEWLCGLSRLPVLVKGVLRGDDARRCVAAGARGVIVSNHGGRQLDATLTGTAALPDVVDEVGADAAVLVDGGIRRGADVLKALALGARAVLVGRLVLWGLATGGADGVATVLSGLREEFEKAMALCGARTVDEITPDLVVPPNVPSCDPRF